MIFEESVKRLATALDSGVETIDLNGEEIVVPNGEHLRFQDCKATLVNGTIKCEGAQGIIISGSDTIVTMGEGIKVDSEYSAIYVEKRGKLIVDGAEITSKDWGVHVVGFTLAKENSSLTMKSGSINSSCIYVEKGGSAIIDGGTITSTSEYDVIVDGSRSKIILDGMHAKVNATNGAEVVDMFAENSNEDNDVEESIADEVTEDVTEEAAVADEAGEVEDVAVEDEDEVEDEVEEVAEAAPADSAETSVEETAPTAAVLLKPTFVYRSPAKKMYIATITGPVKIIDTVNNYYKVSFKMSGTGEIATGFIQRNSQIKF